MTIQETENILNILFVNYPNSFKNWNKTQKDVYKQLWQQTFANVAYKVVETVVLTHIKTSTSQFAPKVGEINNLLLSMITVDGDVEAMDAWRDVLSFIHAFPVEETSSQYDRLSPKTRKVLSVKDLKQLHHNTEEQNQNFEKPRFIKAYKAVKDAEERRAIQTGNLLQIADFQKIEQLEFPATMLMLNGGQLQIEGGENSVDDNKQ